MFKKLREFNDNNTTLYFFLSIGVLIFFLVFNSFSDEKPKDENNCFTSLVSEYSNYEYNIKIKKDNKVVIANVKRYNNKHLIEKTENGEESRYYIHYLDFYKENDSSEFVKTNDTTIVEGIDNKLFFIMYIDEINLSSELVKNNDKDCYSNLDNDMLTCITDDLITVEKDDFTIEYEMVSVSSVKDFSVVIKEGVEEVITPEIEVPSNIPIQ